MVSDIEMCVSFQDYLLLSKDVEDKVGFLVLCFKRLHPDAPTEDNINIGGRIAGIWARTYSKDTGYVLKIIWDSSSASIAGSHLNFIQSYKRNGYKQPVTQQKYAGIPNNYDNKLKKLEQEIRSK
ncbi:MAG: hypothetical protein WC516_09875 [Patescibacteria group bacterium]|jgi:hypothetical protein